MNAKLFFILAAVAWVADAYPRGASKCVAGVNCILPSCRCAEDTSIPGEIEKKYTPQMITLSFSYAFNKHTVKPYLDLFGELVNPNGCPAKGTFFAQYNNTDTTVLAALHKDNHEIALTSAYAKHPKTKSQWRESLFISSERLYDAGITRDQIKGVMAPDMDIGGDDEMGALQDFAMEYDASCVMAPTTDGQTGPSYGTWPWTWDFNDQVKRCNLGNTPTGTYPGIWEFVEPERVFKNHTCTTLSSCSPYITNKGDAFTFFFESFQKHYYGNRAPYVLFIDPEWLTKPHQVEGLKQFLRVVANFEQTWMVPLSKALQWIQSPVPMYQDIHFMPWDCSKEVKEAHMKYQTRK